MKIFEHHPLKAYHTFGIEVDARAFTGVASVDELMEAIYWARQRNMNWLVLGGGSNVLFTSDFDGLVIHMEFQGIEVVDESESHVVIKVGAGEVWDEWVAWAVDHRYAGLENLSLIPGSVGAGPVQNIGAYGVELKDHFHALEFLDFDSGEIREFDSVQCNFGYRSSVFKNELKGKGAVVSVRFRLDKNPVIHSNYGSIRDELSRMGVKDVGIADIRQAVITIRQSKLPDPSLIGNAGSFFKNPVIPNEQFDDLALRFPHVIHFKQNDQKIKLAAGWLIDQCGWKGFRKANTGVHDKQALVLINHGGANGKDILALSKEIQDSVYEKFGVRLEREVNVY